ncbi:hypothetical protein VTO42DRAFT_1906 [Malbranchea cinnamomea]
MRFFSVAVAFIAAAAVQCHPVRRDAGPIISAMDEISAQITTLRDKLSGFNGGLTGTITALEIHAQALKLAGIINDAADAAQDSDPLDENDSAQVANGVTGLQPQIFGVLDDIIAKKPAFDKAILGVLSARLLVKADLELLRGNTADFGAAVTEKLSPEFAKLAPLLLANIDAHFRQAVNVYS